MSAVCHVGQPNRLLALAVAAPASAVPLTRRRRGDQAASAGLTDWAPEQVAGRVVHAPDPNDQDSAFARETNTGTAFLTFALNRDDRLWNNGRARTRRRPFS